MRKFLLILTLYSVSLFSQTVISGRVSSSAYSFERFDSLKNSETYIRGYQQAQLNVAYSKFSLHTSVNLENSYKNPLDYDSRVRFYNLYVEGTNLWNFATIKLGRQPIFSGIAGGVFDGLGVKLTGYNLIADGYVGANVPAYQELKLIDDWSSNNIVAAKVRALPYEGVIFGVGYVSKNFKAEDYWAKRLDENLNPVLTLIRHNSTEYQYLTGEASYEKEENRLFLRTNYEYDLNLNKTSKIEVEGEGALAEKLDAVVYGNYREPRVRYNSIFSVFDFGNTKEVEAGLSYRFEQNFILSGRYGYTDYKDESASRANLSLSTPYGAVSYRKTFGYAGELNSLSLNTGYTLYDGFLTPSAAVSFTDYKLSKDDAKQNLVSFLFGVNIRPVRSFSVDLQGQYLDNKYYQKDVRFLVKLNYWFHQLM